MNARRKEIMRQMDIIEAAQKKIATLQAEDDEGIVTTSELLKLAEDQAAALRGKITKAYDQANIEGNGAVCLLIYHRLTARAVELEQHIAEIRSWSFPKEDEA